MILQQSYGWTDEQLFSRIEFDILTRAALGLDSLEENPFCPATFYNFKNRLLEYYLETGINLVEEVFDSMTADQLKRLNIKTNIQRCDSAFLISNIRNYSRLQLLIEILLRLYRALTDEDKKGFKDVLQPYIAKTSSKYVYSVERSDLPHELEVLGYLYQQLHAALKDSYAEVEIFKIFTRAFEEHFTIIENKVEVKTHEQLHSGCLQSPDDIDATYRKKAGKEAKGQLLNVVETAHPENEVDLITDVSVFANNTDDGNNLNTRLDKLKEKTPDLDQLHTDGAYGNKDNDEKMEQLDITQIQTAVKGREAKVPITIEEKTDEGYIVSCPKQKVTSEPTPTRNKACFDCSICAECEHREDCPVYSTGVPGTHYFDETDYLADKRNANYDAQPDENKKIRPNVEATMKEFTMGYNHKGKLRVRGRFRSMLFAFTMAMAINAGRVYRYGQKKGKVSKKGSDTPNLVLVYETCSAWIGHCVKIISSMGEKVQQFTRLVYKCEYYSIFPSGAF